MKIMTGNMVALTLGALVLTAIMAASGIILFAAQSERRPLLTSQAPPGTGLNLRIIQSGHSLTDPIPLLLRALAIAAGAEPDVRIDRSTMPGSLMAQRWNEAPGEGMPDARAAIALYDLLILTERVPLSNTMPRRDVYGEALRWVEHAWTYGASGQGAPTMLYATWVELVTGPDYDNPYDDPEGHIPWRERLPLEFARWLRIADTVNRRLPAGTDPVRIIPATLVLAAVHDEIAAGRAQGISDIRQFFSDDIHLNESGAYLIALTQFAAIYGISPAGLPPVPAISPPTAGWMQTLVWDVVKSYQTAENRYLDGHLSLAELQQCLWQTPRDSHIGCHRFSETAL